MTSSSIANQPIKVAIAGHRSFIAQALSLELMGRRIESTVIRKDDLAILDLRGFDCVYLVLGRAHPTTAEEFTEMAQLAGLIDNPNKPKKAVYISSHRKGRAKNWCEKQIDCLQSSVTGTGSLCQFIAVRPPAVFGENQDPDSAMLIPSIVKTKGSVELKTPDEPSQFIHVDELARFLADFSDRDWFDPLRPGQPGSSCVIPGTFTATPSQIKALYDTFTKLRTKQISRRYREIGDWVAISIDGSDNFEVGKIEGFDCYNSTHVRLISGELKSVRDYDVQTVVISS